MWVYACALYVCVCIQVSLSLWCKSFVPKVVILSHSIYTHMGRKEKLNYYTFEMI